MSFATVMLHKVSANLSCMMKALNILTEQSQSCCYADHSAAFLGDQRARRSFYYFAANQEEINSVTHTERFLRLTLRL